MYESTNLTSEHYTATLRRLSDRSRELDQDCTGAIAAGLTRLTLKLYTWYIRRTWERNNNLVLCYPPKASVTIAVSP